MIEQYINFYETSLIDSTIPFWLKYSPDYRNGGIFTCLDCDGSVYDTKKYIWHQARAVWMYCRLYRQLKAQPEFLKMAELCLDFIEQYATDVNGRYYFSVRQDGKPYCYQKEVYDPVFCMLAYVEYFRVSGQERYFKKAKKLFKDITNWIAHPEQLSATLQDSPKVSLLGDVMVLADMTIQLAEVDCDPKYIEEMKVILDLLNLHYNDDHKILMEIVALDRADITDWSEGRYYSPGHSIEVACFALEILRYMPDESLKQKLLEVIEGSLKFGWDENYGGILNYVDIYGKPSLWLEGVTKLWWPHFEAIYAILLSYKTTGDQKWLTWLDKVHGYTVEHFADPQQGGWFGFCDRYGKLINTAKGSHSKGFFHVPRTLLKSMQLFGRTQ